MRCATRQAHIAWKATCQCRYVPALDISLAGFWLRRSLRQNPVSALEL